MPGLTVGVYRKRWVRPLRRQWIISSVATAATTGDASITLGALTTSATGTLPITADSTITLGTLTTSATGTLPITADSTITLGTLTTSATGTLPITADSTVTLGALTTSATGALPITADSTVTLGALTTSATGTLPITADSTITLGALTLSSTGVIGDVPILGTASITLGALTTSATGILPITADSTVTLGALTTSATGTLPITADSTITLGALTLNASEAALPPNWLYYKTITVDNTLVPSTQTDYPMLVSIVDTDVGSSAQSSGNDIAFFETDGITKLSHEIESYDSGTGTLVAWVKIPSLTSSVDKVIRMYYGDATIGSQANSEGVWTTDFVMVQHMNQDPSGGAPQMLDSTSNSNDGTSSGTMLTEDLLSSQIGSGIAFDGTDDVIDCGAVTIGTGDFTASFWVDMATATGQDCWLADRALGALGAVPGFFIGTGGTGSTGKMEIVLEATTGALKQYQDPSLAYTVEEGYFLYSFTWDNSADALVIYKNGTNTTADYTKITDTSLVGLDLTATTDLRIGSRPGTTTRCTNGVFDEVRISNVVRSADWNITDYNSQSDPGAFLTVGSEQLARTGNAQITLGALSTSATGTLPIVGTSTITLGALTTSATGALPITADSTVTLGALSTSAVGALRIAGVATITLDGITINTGTPPFSWETRLDATFSWYQRTGITQTIRIENRSAVSTYGEPTYDDSVTVNAFIFPTHLDVHDSSGRTVRSSGHAIMSHDTVVEAGDRLTLSNGTVVLPIKIDVLYNPRNSLILQKVFF